MLSTCFNYIVSRVMFVCTNSLEFVEIFSSIQMWGECLINIHSLLEKNFFKDVIFKIFAYLFWPCCEAGGSQVPHSILALQWKCWILTTGPPATAHEDLLALHWALTWISVYWSEFQTNIRAQVHQLSTMCLSNTAVDVIVKASSYTKIMRKVNCSNCNMRICFAHYVKT